MLIYLSILAVIVTALVTPYFIETIRDSWSRKTRILKRIRRNWYD